jgi:hypothetical protein
VDFKIQVGRDSEEESDSGEFDHRCKCFVVVESFSLSESFYNDTSFVLCNCAIRSPLEFEYPFRINNFAVRRFFGYLIEFHATEDIKFLCAGNSPLGCIWAGHCISV